MRAFYLISLVSANMPSNLAIRGKSLNVFLDILPGSPIFSTTSN